jgi:hypothetical protein
MNEFRAPHLPKVQTDCPICGVDMNKRVATSGAGTRAPKTEHLRHTNEMERLSST